MPWHVQSPVESAAQSGLEESLADNLELLATPQGRELAGVLRAVLERTQFDWTNEALRRNSEYGTYSRQPFPSRSSRDGRPQFGSEGSLQQALLEFFMMAQPIGRARLEEVFGEQKARIQDFISAGLFVREGNVVRLNELSLASVRLKSGEAIYLLADSPAYVRGDPRSRRVYLSDDSYRLRERVENLPPIAGNFADLGSGSGIQLIAAVKQHPLITRAIGMEIDARARNVSQFNVLLNNVGDKITIVADGEALRRELAGQLLAQVVMNPPYIAIPDTVPLPDGYTAMLGGVAPVVQGENGYEFDLRDVYGIVARGGPDGLSVTRSFLDIVLPLMAPGGRIVIMAPFATDSQGIPKIHAFISAYRARRVAITYEASPIDPEFMKFLLDQIRETIGVRYPALNEARFQPVVTQMIGSIAQSMAQQDIVYFQEAFLTLAVDWIPKAGEVVFNRANGQWMVVSSVLGERVFLAGGEVVRIGLLSPVPAAGLEEIQVPTLGNPQPILSAGLEEGRFREQMGNYL